MEMAEQSVYYGVKKRNFPHKFLFKKRKIPITFSFFFHRILDFLNFFYKISKNTVIKMKELFL